MECRCEHVDVFWGSEALAYVSEHLTTVTDDEVLTCPDTGARWHASRDENGQDVLRRIRDAGIVG